MKVKKETKSIKTYRIADRVYEKAMSKARKERTTVSKKIEDMLYDYISR